MQKGLSLVLSKELDLAYQTAIGMDFENERREKQDLTDSTKSIGLRFEIGMDEFRARKLFDHIHVRNFFYSTCTCTQN